MKIVIVGGVAGGASAAARIRRLDETAKIIMFERTEYISYANCGLPYYIGGAIKNKKSLTLNTPEDFNNRFNVDVRVECEVTSINPDRHQVTVKDLSNQKEYTESYDKLVLAPGAKAVKPETKGIDREGVFSLRTVSDTFKIKDYVMKKKPTTAVVIGGGYIGLEMAENLMELDVDVTVVQRSKQVMRPLDWEMAGYLQGYMRDKGLRLKLGSVTTEIGVDNGKLYTVIDDVETLPSDLVIVASGVTPDTDFLKGSGLEFGLKGSIKVNERMETSLKDIYALGDAVEVKNFVTGQDSLIPLAGPANKQGRIVANNICGIDDKFKGSQGSSIIKVFDISVAMTGINEVQAKVAGLNYDKIIICPPAHATYYPGSKNIAMKVVYEKDSGKILGAQLIGFEGTDKRCDVLAVAVRHGFTASDLTELELCYAPPYSSAKDPVNMAGYVIENLITEKISQIYINEVDKIDKDRNIILDVRKPLEYEWGHIPGAINIPLDSLRSEMHKLPKDKKIYVNCRTGLRSYIACRMLIQNGYECANIAGGFYFYANVMKGSFNMAAMHSCGVDIEE